MRNKNLAQQIYCYYIYLFYFDVIFIFSVLMSSELILGKTTSK